MSTGYGIEDFRFSGSYVSRYHHCSGSAVLDESIPGFVAVGEDRAASTLGTRLHRVFERILGECDDVLEAAALLNALADVWGKPRIVIIQDEVSYYRWWILELKGEGHPPIAHDIVEELHAVTPEWLEEDEETGATISHLAKDIVTSPKLIRFLADALRFVHALRDENLGAVMYTEEKRVASWTQTKPKTSADVVLSSKVRLDIVDLKTYLRREVELWVHIIQPGNESSWQVPREYLDQWVVSVLAAEQRILDGDRTRTPGKHCQFCPANPFTKGERGSPNCPEQVEVLFGAEDLSIILEE